jgi:very-short-patch-repair endonuclease
LPFNYTGDGKIMIGGFNPDFLSKNPKHIIEIYGEYHHNLPHNKLKNIVRKRAYNSLGYKLLVIWSKKIIKNPQKVTEKIVNFYVN